MHDIQEFKDWTILIHGQDKLLNNCKRIAKADATDAIMLFESKDYSLFVSCGELTSSVKVTDDEWKGR
jgi:hypothetical protein